MLKSHSLTCGHLLRSKFMNLIISSSCAAERSAIDISLLQRYFDSESLFSMILRDRDNIIWCHSNSFFEWFFLKMIGAKHVLKTSPPLPCLSHVWCWSRYSLIRACSYMSLAGYQCSGVFLVLARYLKIAWLSPRFKRTSPVLVSIS